MSTPLPESIRSRLSKVLSLADGGSTKGERTAAMRQLNALLEKHGVTIDQIREAKLCRYEFKFTSIHEKQLIVQITSKVGGWNKPPTWVPYGSRSRLEVDLTPEQYVDASVLYEYYRKALGEEMKRLEYAFICKHELARPPEAGDNTPPMDPQELQRLLQLVGSLKDRESPLRKGLLTHGSV